MSEVSILLVGDTDRSEFRQARAALCARSRVVNVPDVESAAMALTDGQILPDLIVVAGAYPGEFSRQAIDRLRRLAPLSRVLGLMGSWCEGEMRTGKPWPGAIRIYWHQWLPRCDRELSRMARGTCSTWGLPVTATEEERLMLRCDQPPVKRQGLITIYTRRFDMQDWLSAALRGRGLSTVWLRPPQPARVEGAAAAIFDGSDLRGEELQQLEHLAAALGPAPLVALLNFPRIEDYHRAVSAGAAAVVSKPLEVDDLFWELDRVLTSTCD